MGPDLTNRDPNEINGHVKVGFCTGYRPLDARAMLFILQ
jgi:hypothetical protein